MEDWNAKIWEAQVDTIAEYDLGTRNECGSSYEVISRKLPDDY